MTSIFRSRRSAGRDVDGGHASCGSMTRASRFLTDPPLLSCCRIKVRAAATLVYPAGGWMAFVNGVKDGDFAP
ncbi:hypothetical protein ACQRWP_03365 [Micromonospora trifolii]|uniref:hypothetical protein n=1 Tax=Micromonospora trifolii TaxID=2911208 RepID=UPI003D2F06D9